MVYKTECLLYGKMYGTIGCVVFDLNELFLSFVGSGGLVYVLGFLCLGSEKKSKDIVLMFPGICIVVAGRGSRKGVCC